MDVQGARKSATILGCLIEILDLLEKNRNKTHDKKGWASDVQATKADATLLVNECNVGGDHDDDVQVGLMSKGIVHVLDLLFIMNETEQDHSPISTIIKAGIQNLEGIVPGFSLALYKVELMEQIQVQSEELSNLEHDKAGAKASRGTGKQAGLMGFVSSDFYDAGLRVRVEDEKRKLQRDETRLAKADELFHEAFFSWLRDIAERKLLAIDIAALRRILATLIGIIIKLVDNQRRLYGIEGCIEKLAVFSSIDRLTTITDTSSNAELDGVIAAMQESSRKLAEIEAELEDGSLDDDVRRGLIASREHHAKDIMEYGHTKILLEERSRNDARKQEGENNARLLIEVLECVRKGLVTMDSR